MRIYVINLVEAVARRESISRQLNRLELPFTIIKGVVGKEISLEDSGDIVDLEAVRKHPYWLTPGMVGAALSHREAYKKMQDAAGEWGLVLEDDVVLSRELMNLLTLDWESLPTDQLYLLYATCNIDKVRLSSAEVFDNGDFRFHKILNPVVGGGGAYLLHQTAALKLLQMNPKVSVAPDTWHYFLKQGVFSKLNCIHPFLARPGYFESNIGYVKESSMTFRIKHFLDQNNVPMFKQFLKWNRKRVWQNHSKIIFEGEG